jgi:hypothetical protein
VNEQSHRRTQSRRGWCGVRCCLSTDVVGRAPHGDELLVEHVFETLHDELMCACDDVDVIRVIELFHDVRAEEEARNLVDGIRLAHLAVKPT